MIGLTAGLVIEGQTGKSILAQVYLLFSLFVRMYVFSLSLSLSLSHMRKHGSLDLING